jgi:pimeloyl-ACP methyl ester carboxylesterase
MNHHSEGNDSKSSHDVMRSPSPIEQLHVMSGQSSGRSSLELPDQEGMSNVYPHWRSWDPRNSSSQSLAPTLGDSNGRRTLLVVYLHGFMGNDSSFRSFPAHVHSYLKEALEETHVVHTKIYPRYKTYKSIDVARDNFSKWLEPHESYTTDVVLVGHSMGGLLAADVALIVSTYLMI